MDLRYIQIGVATLLFILVYVNRFNIRMSYLSLNLKAVRITFSQTGNLFEKIQALIDEMKILSDMNLIAIKMTNVARSQKDIDAISHACEQRRIRAAECKKLALELTDKLTPNDLKSATG